MRWVRSVAMLAAWLAVAGVGGATVSSDSPSRTELKRADLAGTPGMEVISSISVYTTGEELPRHFHHGIETGYAPQCPVPSTAAMGAAAAGTA